jgi:2',3'-cyclic-nucleotide 2'-phosphodiesterase (5'-nucleotidase family)
MKKLISTLAVIIVLLVILGSNISCRGDSKLTNLTILHTNDTHASLNDIGRRATIVKQIRDQTGKDNVLLVDSGDVFTGSLYFTVAQGQADLWFMKYMGYDAMGLGNHEFDKGPEVLADFVDQSGFPVLCANFDFSKEKSLAGKISPWTIIQKGSEKYGIFALTIEQTNEISSPGKNIVINDAFQSAQAAIAALQKQGINKIIALSSLGWERDLHLALQVKDIDVIAGGHSNTVPEAYPAVVENSGAPTLIVQAGSQGKYLGDLILSFDEEGIIKSWDKSRLITIDDTIESDPACIEKLLEYQKPILEMMNNIIGKTLASLDGEKNHIRALETNLGNLVADAMLEKASPLGASIAIVNSGAIRSSVPAGDLSLGQVLEILPYGNYLVSIELSGQQIIGALENGVSQVDQLAGRFPQVAGLRFAWDPQSPVGDRIVSVDIKTGDSYQPLEPAVKYKIATNDFLAGGGDGYTMFVAGKAVYSRFVDFEVLQDYIKTRSPIKAIVEGRITQIKK